MKLNCIYLYSLYRSNESPLHPLVLSETITENAIKLKIISQTLNPNFTLSIINSFPDLLTIDVTGTLDRLSTPPELPLVVSPAPVTVTGASFDGRLNVTAGGGDLARGATLTVGDDLMLLERGDLSGDWCLLTVMMAVEVVEMSSERRGESDRRGEWKSSSWESVSEIERERWLVAELWWRLRKSMVVMVFRGVVELFWWWGSYVRKSF